MAGKPKKLLRSGFEFLWDFVISHFPAIVVAFVGGGAVSAAAAVTDWLKVWGPILWVALFFAGAIFGLLLYGAFVWISRQAMINKFAKLAAESGSVNILEDVFDKKDIKIQEFYSPFYFPNNNKRFTKCRISGPGMVITLNGIAFIRCRFSLLQIVIAKPGPLRGGIFFADTTFMDSEIVDLTLVMNKETYDMAVAADKGFMTIPVISGN